MIRVTQPRANLKHWMEKDDPRIGRIAQLYIIISEDFPESIIDTAKLYEEDIVFAIKNVFSFYYFWRWTFRDVVKGTIYVDSKFTKLFTAFFYLLLSLLHRVVKYRWQN